MKGLHSQISKRELEILMARVGQRRCNGRWIQNKESASIQYSWHNGNDVGMPKYPLHATKYNDVPWLHTMECQKLYSLWFLWPQSHFHFGINLPLTIYITIKIEGANNSATINQWSSN